MSINSLASNVVTAAPSTGVTNGQTILGIAAQSFSLNDFGLVQILGNLRGLDTSAYTTGDILQIPLAGNTYVLNNSIKAGDVYQLNNFFVAQRICRGFTRISVPSIRRR